MKKLLFFTLFLFLVINLDLIAQSHWKFHVAYEDATGARDTIWFIWDTTATFYGLDTALGEKIVSIDTSTFNVWTNNPSSTTYDTIKTFALPYIYPSFGQEIRACHFVLPMIISWDSSLLHADWLPPEPVGWINVARLDNDYFYAYNNNFLLHQFDMTIDDHIMAPDTNVTIPWFWLPEHHFPMFIALCQDPYTGKMDTKYIPGPFTTLYPNPVINTLFIKADQLFDQAQIVDLNGKEVLTKIFNVNEASINVSQLPPGIYIIHLISDKGYSQHRKFIIAY